MMRILTVAWAVWLKMLRRKDAYVLLILLGALLLTLVSLNVFNLGGVTGYVKDIGLAMAWLFAWILAVNTASRELPNEETRGTVYALLAKPVTRLELIVGKWLGTWSIVTVCTLLFYALVGLVTLARGGHFGPATAAQGFFLHALALGIIVAATIALSTRMNYDAAASMAFVLSGALFLVLPKAPEFLARVRGIHATALLVLYNLMPHLELFDMRKRMVHDFEPVGWVTLGLVTLYGVLVTALFVLLAWIGYRRKRFSRGTTLSE
jgi:ABC-type transport system involved in multi-copper enzyme maturation permease subunit